MTPPTFSHCLIQEDQPGVGNLIGEDPLFNSDLGMPYLSPLSPCIDAGDPGPLWNDPEDPANPGFALWPSQGGLRNDMGYTGGPRAATIDTSWVELRRQRTRSHLPQVFSLGNPYPNPFNPLTLVPYTLTRRQHVRLVVYNVAGQQVTELMSDFLPAGSYTAQFGTRGLASGLYFITLESEGRSETRSVTLVR